MNSFILIESTTGTPIHFAAYRPDFGLPLDPQHVADARLVAMSSANLISTLRIRAADVFQSGKAAADCEPIQGFRGFESEQLQSYLYEDSANKLLCIVATEPSVPAAIAAQLSRHLGELFVRDHAAAIAKAATGVVRSYKKVFRPVLSKLLWSMAEEAIAPIRDAVHARAGAPWVYAVHSPELATAAVRGQMARKAGRAFVAPSGDELLSSSADLLGAGVTVCVGSSSGTPPLYLDGAAPTGGCPDRRHEAQLHRSRILAIALRALRLHAHTGQGVPRRAAIRLGPVGLEVLVWPAMIVVFPAPDAARAELLRELLPDDDVGVCESWLRFLHDHKVPHPDDPVQEKEKKRRHEAAAQ